MNLEDDFKKFVDEMKEKHNVLIKPVNISKKREPQENKDDKLNAKLTEFHKNDSTPKENVKQKSQKTSDDRMISNMLNVNKAVQMNNASIKMQQQNMDKRLKMMNIQKKEYENVDVTKELKEVTGYFREKIPVIKDIALLLNKFDSARKNKQFDDQIKIWNELLGRFIEFDIGADIAGEKMRKITHELVKEAETLNMKGDVLTDVENRSNLL